MVRKPEFWDFRDFALGIFSMFKNPDPDPWDFGIFGILKSRSRSPGFRVFSIEPKQKIPIPKKSYLKAISAKQLNQRLNGFHIVN